MIYALHGMKKVTLKIPPHFYWARSAGGYLLTNDSGEHLRLTAAQFRRYVRRGSLPPSAAQRELLARGFVRDRLDLDGQAEKWSGSNAYLRRGPGLHIFVVTQRCNHACLYCQSSASAEGARGADMSVRTARRSVDFALQAPGEGLTIEFQGGEPLLNWPVVKETILYGERKAAAAGKDLKFALVSNFSLMTQEKAEFLVKHGAALCTSLDGPAGLHDRNRSLSGGGSHAVTVKWIRYFSKKLGPGSDCGPSALLTVTRYSLGLGKEIVDEYVRLGLESIFVRPLAPIGFAARRWSSLGYGSDEFVKFYGDSLKYVLKLNSEGVRLREKTAFLIAKKALGFRDNNYVDLRCPCGAGLGQLAYNSKGEVYTCDEGRMLGWQGDGLFRAGSVHSGSYSEAVSSRAVRACAAASSLDLQPACSRCVWRPYCGVCPVYNYQAQGSLWGDMPSNWRCRVLKGVFETVFSLLGRSKEAAAVKGWLD
jgi:His-Xaa-Ser system radical SAM maturase HxsB